MIPYLGIIAMITILGFLYNCVCALIKDRISVQLTGESNGPLVTDRIIVKFEGSSYDITNFIKFHPGGKKILIEQNGKDIKDLMLKHKHSSHAYDILQKYKL